MKKYKLGVVLLTFSFLVVHFTCPKVFNFCPQVSSVFSSQVVYADTNLSKSDQEKVKEYYKLARQYYKKGNYERTIAECQKMLEIDAYNANAHKLIKKSEERLKKLKAKKVEKQREKEKQIEKQAEKQKQRKIAELFGVANGLYSDKKYDETIAQCMGILKIDSDNKSAKKLTVKSEERIQIAREKELVDKKKIAEQARLEAQKQAEKDRKLREEAKEEKIDRLVRKAKQLYKDKDYKQALIIYQEVLSIDSENKKALKMAEKTREKIDISEQETAKKASKLAKLKAEEDTKKESALIALQKKKIKERKQTEKEELEDRIETHYKNGKKLYRNDEYSDAIKEFNAVLSLDSAHEGAKEYLTASEESLKEQNERISVQQANTAKKEIARKESLRKRDIQDGINNARVQIGNGEYDKAVNILEKLLPGIPEESLRKSAELLINEAKEKKVLSEEKIVQKKLETAKKDRMLAVAEAQLPPSEARRRKELELKEKKADTAAKRLRNKASSIKVPLVKYTGADLRDVVLFLIKQTGINIVVDEAIFSGGVPAPVAAPAAPPAEGGEEVAAQPAVQPAAGPTNTKVTCFLQNMTLLSVLEAILRPKGLDYKFTNEYIWVSTKDRIIKQPLEDLEVRWFSLDFGAEVTPMRLTEAGFEEGGDVGFAGADAGADAEGGGKLSGEDVVEFIREFVAQPVGSSLKLLSTQNKLVAKNTPENLDKIQKLLDKLAMPMQVSIEARFVDLTETDLQDLGVYFTSLSKSWQAGKVGPIGGKGESHTVLGDLNYGTSNLASGGVNYLTNTGLNLLWSAVLNRFSFGMVVNALEEMSNVNTLFAPKVTTVNGKSAIIRFITKYKFASDIEVDSSTSDSTPPVTTVTYNYTFTDYEVGTVLNVTPRISETTKDINLFIQPVVSSISGWTSFTLSVIGGVPHGVSQPIKSIKDVETNLIIHDGDTVVLGGFITDDTTKYTRKVPFLGDIPLLGKLFSWTASRGTKRNLLIFVTVNLVTSSGRKISE